MSVEKPPRMKKTALSIARTRSEDALAGMTHVYIENIAENPDILKIELHSLLEGNPATHYFFQNRWKSFTDYIEFGLNEYR